MAKKPSTPSTEKQQRNQARAREVRALARLRRRGQLTDQQKVFRNEYMLDLNAKRAALRSGYSDSYSSKVVAFWVGPDRQACPPKFRHVWDAMNNAKQQRLERTQFDADKVLETLAEVAHADVACAFDPEGGFLPIHLIPPEVRKLIAGIKVRQVKMADELRELLGKLYDMDHDLSTNISALVIPEIIEIKFYSRLDAIGMIGKHVKVQAFRDSVKLDLPPRQLESEEDIRSLLALGRQLTLVEALAAPTVDVTTESHDHADTTPAAGIDAGALPTPAEPDAGAAGLHPGAGEESPGAGGEVRS